MEIQGIRTPLGKQLRRGFTDLVSVERNMIALYANLEPTFGTGQARKQFSTVNVFGETKVNFRLSEPEAEGYDWTNPDIAGMAVPPKTATTVKGGRMLYPSGYRVPSEAYSEGVVKTYETDEATKMYLKDVYVGIKDGFYAKWEEHLFPTIGLVFGQNIFSPGSATGIDGQDTPQRILAFGYPFQNGGLAGADPTTETFNYLGIPFNDPRWANAKGIVSGSELSPFGVPSNSNIRRKILYPMFDRKAKADLILTDDDIYDFMINDAEGRVQLKQMETFTWGGMHRILPDGNILCKVANMTRQAALTGIHKIYFADAQQLHWNMDGDVSTNVMPIPFNEGFFNISAGCFVKHLIDNPRLGGLADYVLLS